MATGPTPIAVLSVLPVVTPPLPQTGLPTTEQDLLTALSGIENRLNLYLNDPSAFFAFFGNSIKIDVGQYIAALERRRAELLVQLQNIPTWSDSDADPNGPMIKQY